MEKTGSVECAKKHIAELSKKRKITVSNGKHILSFVAQLQAQGHRKGPYSKKRLTKYLYGLGSLSQMTARDFEKHTKEDMNELALKIREKYKQETARDYIVMLRLFIKYIWEQKGNEYEENEYPDIVKKIKPGNNKSPKIARAQLLNMDDVKAMANLTKNLRDRCFIIMLYESGCRIGELIGDETHPGVHLRDIKNDQYGVIIDVEGKTGTRSLRLVSSSPAIANWLQIHPDRENKDAPLLCGIWGAHRGQRVDYRYWKNLLNGKSDNRKRPTDKKIPMKGLGEKAGIQKPVNPHAFRHARASELAQFLTESQLCYFMGWEQGSKQTRTYVHLSGKDIDNSILLMNDLGQEKKQENKMKPIRCPRCGQTNDFCVKYCSSCSLLLDVKSIATFDQESTQIDSMKKQIDTLMKQVKMLMNNNDFYEDSLYNKDSPNPE